MAKLLIFHHVLGITRGLQEFANALRAEGHDVLLPDLFDGATFDTVEDGVAFAEPAFNEIRSAASAIAEGIEGPVVMAGFSLGSVLAQQLAQTNDSAVGAILYDGAHPAGAFGRDWPNGTRLQIHVVAGDEWVEIEDARHLAVEADGEIFVYPGTAHLVADSSASGYDPVVRDEIISRSLAFLQMIDRDNRQDD